MSTAAAIGLGLLTWVVAALLVALFMGRMIRMRDQQRPTRTEPGDEPAIQPDPWTDVTHPTVRP